MESKTQIEPNKEVESEKNYSGESLLESDDFIPEVVTPQEKAKMKNIHHQEKGFGVLLIEALVACSILLIITAMTAVSATKMVQANNQNNAITLLRSVNKSEGWYSRIYHNGYNTPAVLANSNTGGIGGVATQSCQTPGLIGAEAAATVSVTRTFSGYSFTFTPGSTSPITGSGCATPGYSTYTLTANPISPASGNYSFFTDQTGILRFATGGPANAASPLW